MIDLSKIDELAQRLSDALPPQAQQFREEMEAQFRQVLKKGLNAADLVSREDFEAQKNALERATVKLQALEQRLAALESDSS